MNTAALKSGHYDYVREELDALVGVADYRPVSVILQTPLLSQAEVAAAALMCVASGVDYIEPIHGFGKFTRDGEQIFPAEVDPKDVKLMKQVVGDKMGVRVTGRAERLIQVLVMFSNGAEHMTLPNAMEMLDKYEALVERLEPYSE
jgi:deoxyribose-phosphate aldolase